VVLFSAIGTLLIYILFAQRFSALSDYLPKTPIYGGTYSEGTIGKIEQLNPLFSPLNPAEQSAVSLIFSGLTKRDNNRMSVPDLAERWEIAADGKTYTFFLKKDLRWQDGKNLNADDVIFTINAIQNPDTRSPLLETWKGIEVTKKDDSTVVFKLSSPYPAFVSNTDVPIIPKHILENTPAKNLKTSEFNSSPVGSGPYSFEKLKKVKETTEVDLKANEKYYSKKPYIESINLKTYPDYPQLTLAYARKEVQGITKLPVSELKKSSELPNIETYNLAIPTYDAIYFNLREGIGKEKYFREAISLSLNRKELIEKAYDGQALPVYTPIIPGFQGYDSSIKQAVNIDEAKKKLTEAGYVLGADGLMAKGEQKASARLVIQDDYQKIQTAEQLREQCKRAGIEILIEKYPAGTFYQDYVRDRNFDILLVSQNLGSDSDIYGFWHSSQVNDPGLNFSGYSDRKLDKFLEQARQTADPNIIYQKYSDVSKIIATELPAIYLVWPDYLFGLSKEVSGFKPGRYAEPKDRFFNITEWFVRDKVAK
jgi:peptide/nickel transport system substrate-binding protein